VGDVFIEPCLFRRTRPQSHSVWWVAPYGTCTSRRPATNDIKKPAIETFDRRLRFV
jgi:hypothetical protein